MATSNTDENVSLVSFIRRSTDDLECCVCLTKQPLSVVFSCTHEVCLCCFKKFSVNKLNQRQFTYKPDIGYTLGCPCGCPDTLINDPHVFRLMNKRNYERYKNFAAEEYVLHNHGLLCPTPGCGSGLIIDQSPMKIVCPLSIGCGKVFCRNCKEIWKDESLEVCPCQMQEDLTNRISSSTLNESTIKTSEKELKKCPTCYVWTEKDGGCNAISCSRCGTTWCWICENNFQVDCIQSHWF